MVSVCRSCRVSVCDNYDVMMCVWSDPGEYFEIDPVSGVLTNKKPLLLSDPNWSPDNAIIVQVRQRLVGLYSSRIHFSFFLFQNPQTRCQVYV